jgi:hypothetical protein
MRKLLVTHHAPDLDAVGAVWMLKRFDAQHYADAKIAFVNPGETISLEEAEKFGNQLHEVTHVDTGLGEFDHHGPNQGYLFICATSLTYDHCCKVHPELKQDRALAELVNFVTQIDHFKEIDWPDAGNLRYNFMIHELISGLEHLEFHNDDSQMQFGMTCLDSAYAKLTQKLKAVETIENDKIEFELPFGKAFGVETSNDDVIKTGQKMGYHLVVRKDPKLGNIRIKMRPDTPADLNTLYQKIKHVDQKGTWFNHPNGKMLINGSQKHRSQKASPLSLDEVIALIKETYGTT